MADFKGSDEALLQKRLGLDQPEIERRLRLVDFRKEDAARVQALSGIMEKHADEFTAAFFQYLKSFAEATGLFGDARLVQEATRLKREHLKAMATGNYGPAYVSERLRLAVIYAKAGLETKVFLGAFHQLMRLIGFKALEGAPDGALAAFDRFMALKKVAFFDLSLIIDAIVDERERVIGLQQQAIRELSTPVLAPRDRLLVLPIIGTVDTERARLMTQGLLEAIRAQRAVAVVIDITGVPVVDTQVANHLSKTAASAKLMGASVIVTGVSSEVARVIVSLGVDVRSLETTSDLRSGMLWAERLLASNLSKAGS